MSNNGLPPLNDWQSDNYPVIYDEGESTLKYVKTGNKVDISTGGSSYLVYTANISQSGTSAPTKNEFQNDFSACTWTRNDAGDYRGDFADDVTFTSDDIYIAGSFITFNANANFFPIYDYSAVVGYYRLTPEVNAGHFRLYLEVYNGTWTLADISAVTGGNANLLSLPEVRVYAS